MRRNQCGHEHQYPEPDRMTSRCVRAGEQSQAQSGNRRDKYALENAVGRGAEEPFTRCEKLCAHDSPLSELRIISLIWFRSSGVNSSSRRNERTSSLGEPAKNLDKSWCAAFRATVSRSTAGVKTCARPSLRRVK